MSDRPIRSAVGARRRSWLSSAVAALVASAPFVTAGGRALATSWYPIGDNAYFTLRARDVLTEHHPLLGTWTSASLTVGEDINNPGPLLFDLLAAPTKLDPAAGTVVAVVLMHLLSVVVGVRWAFRVAGEVGAWAVAAGFAALAWVMGSELLVEPWQPHSLLPPFLTFLVLIWAVAAGEADAVPWAAVVASLILQTYLSYALLVPALALGGVAVLLVRTRRSDGRASIERLRRPAILTGAVLGVAWAQSLFDQVARQGNLMAVATNGAGGDEIAGLGFAARVLASVGAVPGGWGRGGFEGLRMDLAVDRPPGEPPVLTGLAAPGTAAAWSVLALVVVSLAAWAAWRRADQVWLAGIGVAATAIAVAVVSVALLPVSPVLGVAPHQLRPIWPVVIFATVVVAATLLRSVPPRWWRLGPAVAIALVLLALPAHNPRSGPSADVWAMPVVRDLVGQLDALDGSGLTLVDLSVIRFAEPYSSPVMLELQRRGIPFVVDDEIAIGQLGRSRAASSDDAIVQELRIVDGDAALDPEPGWQRVAFVAGLDPSEEADLERLRSLGLPEDRARIADLQRRRFFETAAVLVRTVEV